MKSRIPSIAFLVVILGCSGRAATEANGESAGSSSLGGAASSNGRVNNPRSSGGGLVNAIVYPDDAGLGGTGGAPIGAGGDEAANASVVLSCAPDNLSLLMPCTTPILIGAACDPTTFHYCREGAENVLCGAPGSCAPVSDAGGYYD
jgi:hypothetical protein